MVRSTTSATSFTGGCLRCLIVFVGTPLSAYLFEIASFASAAVTRNFNGPTRSSSPSLSGTSLVIRSSLTYVPLRLPKSRTV